MTISVTIPSQTVSQNSMTVLQVSNNTTTVGGIGYFQGAFVFIDNRSSPVTQIPMPNIANAGGSFDVTVSMPSKDSISITAFQVNRIFPTSGTGSVSVECKVEQMKATATIVNPPPIFNSLLFNLRKFQTTY